MMKRILRFFLSWVLCLSLLLFVPASLAEPAVEIEEVWTEEENALFEYYYDHTSLELGLWDGYKLRKDLMQDGYESLCVYELEGNVYAFAELYQEEEEVISYLILGEDRALMWDTGLGIYDFKGMVERITDLPLTVLISHEHYDHICGNMYFDGVMCYDHPDVIKALTEGVSHDEYVNYRVFESFTGEIPAYVNPKTVYTPGRAPVGVVEDGEVIDLGGRKLEVMNVRGHTDASIVLFDAENHILFPGDMFYLGPIIVIGDRESAMQVYIENMSKILKHAEELEITHIYGSHNAVSEGLEDMKNVISFAVSILAGANPYTTYRAYGEEMEIYVYKPKMQYQLWVSYND